MNKFKKFMALGLAAMMVTSLVACGGSTGNAKNKKSEIRFIKRDNSYFLE